MDLDAEWLEPDGLGGFASGTVGGIRTRRYHALLLGALHPPSDRYVLVNGYDAWIRTPAGVFPLSSHQYTGDVVHPDGVRRLTEFEQDPWPRWRFELEDGTAVEQECFVPQGQPRTALSWHLLTPRTSVQFYLRLLLSGRDYHQLHHENSIFRFDAQQDEDSVTWRPYNSLPAIVASHNGTYVHGPEWYHRFLYREEQARGLDCIEDLASPGTFQFDLSRGEAVVILNLDDQNQGGLHPETMLRKLRTAERRRRKKFPSRLQCSANAYLVQRGQENGKTMVAGYPWFTDWGRDTFVAFRGLCLATQDMAAAEQVLLTWAVTVSDGMLPNRFPDGAGPPEYNSVDASLWFVIAAYEFLEIIKTRPRRISTRHRRILEETIDAILSGYAKGTRYGIHMDRDGLLAAGESGFAITWMDAQVDGHAVSPRIGKPVEVQALWINALQIGGVFSQRWQTLWAPARETFRERFWNETRGCLYDVVDVDHQPGKTDAAFRPNQIFAAGGLPFPVIEGKLARRVVDAVEAALWTPLGLRTLSPDDPRYVARYEGDSRQRDLAYHQGTAWPWLIGPFVEAWVRVRGGTLEAHAEARSRFLAPLERHLRDYGLGHICEIADGEGGEARGCPFQAWSLGEFLRLSLVVLQDTPTSLPHID
jgi:predicted glycogen debranching enzyme